MSIKSKYSVAARVINSVIVLSCLFPPILFSVHAADAVADHSRVNMQGSIIDTVCAIALDNREQRIDIPLAERNGDGGGRRKPFAIKLINCLPLSPANKANGKPFQVTFDGDVQGELFSVDDYASGAGLQIADESGNIALPGKALPHVDIHPDSIQLHYFITLVASNNQARTGNYSSSLRFRLDYF